MKKNNLYLTYLLILFIPNFLFAQKTLSLKEAINIARVNSPYLLTKQFEVQIAEADIIKAQTRPNPVLNNQSLFYTDTYNYPESSAFYNGVNNQLFLQLTKRMQINGQRNKKTELATQASKVTSSLYNDEERNLIYLVSQKWLEFDEAKMELDLIRSIKEEIDSLLNPEDNESEEVLRRSLMHEKWNLETAELQQAYTTAFLELKHLIGTEDTFLVKENESIFSSIPIIKDSLLSIAYTKRADYKAAKEDLRLSLINQDLQRKLAIPDIEAGIIYNPQNTAQYWGTYLTVPIPAFDVNKSEIERSKVIHHQSEKELELLRLRIKHEVEDGFQAYQTSLQNFKTAELIVNLGERLFAKIRVKAVNLHEYFEELNELIRSKQIYFRSQMEVKKGYLNLLYVSGSLDEL